MLKHDRLSFRNSLAAFVLRLVARGRPSVGREAQDLACVEEVLGYEYEHCTAEDPSPRGAFREGSGGLLF